MANKIISTCKRPADPAEWLSSRMDLGGRTNAEIARMLGVPPALVSHWRNGRQSVPIARLVTLANLIGADPVYIRGLALETYRPEALPADRTGLQSVTENECDFLEILRESAVPGAMMNEDEEEAFRRFVETLADDRGLTAASPEVTTVAVGAGAHKNLVRSEAEERRLEERRAARRRLVLAFRFRGL